MTIRTKIGSVFAVVIAAVTLLGCTHAVAKSSSQGQGQRITEAYSQKLTNAEPYPLDAMNDSAERANLRERLVRLNDPHKVGYLYGLSSTGQVMAFWTIHGKPSSMGSQLTPSQNIYGCPGDNSACGAVVESMGDDGSFGPEECSATGVFAFTADSNALVEWCGPWFYSDAPLKLSTAPVIVVDANAKPTSDTGLNKKP